jgi:predicted ATP-grasp superfamily ATP-dependent carboligase
MTRVGAIIIGGDFQGLGVVRSLASHGVPICLVDSNLCIGRFSRYVNRFVKSPSVRDEQRFLDFLHDLAEREDVGGWVVYPNDDETVSFLARHKRQLEECFRIPTPEWQTVRAACEKKATYQLAESAGIAVPKTFYPESVGALRELDLEYPAIIKPSVKEPFYSKVRKKAILVRNAQELVTEFERAAAIVDSHDIMIQEFIPGGPDRLFSVGSLFKEGEFLGKVVVRRTRQHPMDFGHATTFAETVDIPELEEIAARILGLIGYYGLSEVEFMHDPGEGRYKLLEVNARQWGWHTLAIAAGVDLPYLLYQDMMGETVKCNGFEKGMKWVRLTTDTPTAFLEMVKGNMRITDYLRSMRGRKQLAVLSLRDPLPFFVELVMIPYLWKRRGF